MYSNGNIAMEYAKASVAEGLRGTRVLQLIIALCLIAMVVIAFIYVANRLLHNWVEKAKEQETTAEKVEEKDVVQSEPIPVPKANLEEMFGLSKEPEVPEETPEVVEKAKKTAAAKKGKKIAEEAVEAANAFGDTDMNAPKEEAKESPAKSTKVAKTKNTQSKKTSKTKTTVETEKPANVVSPLPIKGKVDESLDIETMDVDESMFGDITKVEF